MTPFGAAQRIRKLSTDPVAEDTARCLGHAVVLVSNGYRSFRAYAIQLQGKPE